MNVVYYYRCADPALKNAKAQDNTESLDVQTKAQAFAAIFGGQPVFGPGPTPSMIGITFPKPARPKNPLLWTQPTKTDIRQFPLPKIKVPKLRAPLAELVKEWNENFPTEITRPRVSYLLAALGLVEARIDLSYFFDRDGASWIAVTRPMDGEQYVELKASEFDAARAAWDLWQEELHQMPTLQMTPVAPVPEAAND